MNEYLTVLNETSYEMIERKSKFIASVKPVGNECEAIEFIKKISEENKNATHNVYAYIIKDGVEINKASDDGEPQGTAGVPVLEVIKKENLINVCIVVTRYFGGILLGAGGLIRAYSSAAREGIHKAKICNMAIYKRMSVILDYTLYGKVQNSMQGMGITILDVEYSDVVKMFLKVKYDDVEYITKAIYDMTNGSAKIEHLNDYFDVYEVF